MTRVVVGAARRGGTPPEWASRLIAMQEFHAAAVLSTTDAIIAAVKEQVATGHRVVLVCATELDQGHVMGVLPQCRELGAEIVAVLSPTDAELIHDVMLAGAAGYRIQPGPFEPLVADIRKAATRPAPTAAGPRLIAEHGRIVAVTSASGGAGKTAVATRLAAVAARSLPADQVGFIDLNLSCGAGDIAFGVEAERTLANVLPAAGELEREDLLRATASTPDGVRFLAPPADLEQSAHVQGSDVAALLTDCRRAFDLTIVDTASYVDDILIAALRGSDASLVVVTPDLVSIRNALRLCEMARRLGIPRERLCVVLNGVRSGKHGQAHTSDRELEAAFTGSVIATIPLMAGLRADCSDGDEHIAGLAGGPSVGAMTALAREVGRTIGLEMANPRRLRDVGVGASAARRALRPWRLSLTRSGAK